MHLITRLAPLVLLLSTGCTDVDDDDHDHGDHDHGVVTTLTLNFTPVGGGDILSFTWSDPLNDANPTIDSIDLPDASDHDHHDTQAYDVDVEIWNDLQDPAEDVTPEILDLAEEHQVFFTGSAVEGPATGSNTGAVVSHAYDDEDSSGLPLGLANTLTTTAWGSGNLTVTLRHLPMEDGQPVKVEGLAGQVADGGFDTIGGDNDIRVVFPITVE